MVLLLVAGGVGDDEEFGASVSKAGGSGSFTHGVCPAPLV
jgi:hypothetical protein